MRNFFTSISGGSDFGLVPIPEVSDVVAGSYDAADYNTNTWYYFKPYLAADFPMLSGLDKKYFFVWSSDHGSEGTYWGTGDDLFLTDLVVKGQCIHTEWTPETPVLKTYNGKCYFFYHNWIDGFQQTKLYTTTGNDSSLTRINDRNGWEFQGAVLGLHRNEFGNQIGGVDENHTGYFSCRDADAVEINAGSKKFIGFHLAAGGAVGILRYSESDDLINWTRLQPDVQKYYRIDEIPGTQWKASIGTSHIRAGDNLYNFHGGANEDSYAGNSAGEYIFALDTLDENHKNPVFRHRLLPLSVPPDSIAYYRYLDKETETLIIYERTNKTELRVRTLDMSKAHRWDLENGTRP